MSFSVGVDEDREVEVVAHELLAAVADLEHVQPLEDQDVGLAHRHPAAFDDVVHDVAVDRRIDLGDAALQLAQEPQQASRVVALRKPLAVHDAALLQHRVRVEEAVGRHQIDLRMVGPAGQQRLQDASERALADRHAAGHTDHVRHLRCHRAEERRRHPMQVLRRVDVQVEQPAQRQVDGDDLVEVDLLVDAAQLDEVGLAQGHRGRRPEHRPVVTVETEEPVRHGTGPYAHGVPTTESTGRTRKQLGAWYTPDELVDLVVDRTIDHTFAARDDSERDRPVRVLDPACGDGRFLVSAARRLRALGRDASADRCRRRSASRRRGRRARRRADHGRRPLARLGASPVRRGRRQPAVPLADVGVDHPRRRQPARRWAVRRRGGRVPRPRDQARRARRRPGRPRPPAVDPRVARRRARPRACDGCWRR